VVAPIILPFGGRIPVIFHQASNPGKRHLTTDEWVDGMALIPSLKQPNTSGEMVVGLPEPYREAMLLTQYQGMSQVELAAEL